MPPQFRLVPIQETWSAKDLELLPPVVAYVVIRPMAIEGLVHIFVDTGHRKFPCAHTSIILRFRTSRGVQPVSHSEHLYGLPQCQQIGGRMAPSPQCAQICPSTYSWQRLIPLSFPGSTYACPSMTAHPTTPTALDGIRRTRGTGSSPGSHGR